MPDRLKTLELQVQKGLAGAIKALAEIKRRRLYLKTHVSFEQYCRDRWGKSSRRLRQLLDAEDVKRNLPAGAAPNERQARELAKLDPDAQQTAWDAAQGAGTTTAGDLKALLSDALESLDPVEQARRIRENSERTRERMEKAKVVSGGDGRKERLEQIHRLVKRLRKLTEGVGFEAEPALPHLDAFEEAIQQIGT